MIKYFLFLTVGVLATARLAAQLNKQIDTAIYSAKPIIPADRAELLKNVNVIFNTQYANNNYFTNGKYTNTAYGLNQFRLEVIGQIYDGVTFRFRDRYTRDQVTQSVDNTNHSVDIAFINFRISTKWSAAFGKMSADYGGYEFEANPIYIYQYNDIIAHADDFQVGAGVSWQVSPRHRLGFQLLNARTQTFGQIYDSVPGVTPSKFPAMAVSTWRGSFAKNRFNTIWSFAAIREAQRKYIYYLALGNQLSLKKWLVQYDLKINPENLDRSGIVSGFLPQELSPYRALKTFYLEHWLHVEYSFASQWKASMTAYSSDAWWFGNPDPHRDSHLRSSYGLIPSVEFYPYKKLNLKFFAAYIGRYYDYSGYSRKQLGLGNSTTGQFEIGFIAPLVVL